MGGHPLVDRQWQATVRPPTALSSLGHRRQALVGENLVVDRRWPDIRFPPWVANDGVPLVAYYRWADGVGPKVYARKLGHR